MAAAEAGKAERPCRTLALGLACRSRRSRRYFPVQRGLRFSTKARTPSEVRAGVGQRDQVVAVGQAATVGRRRRSASFVTWMVIGACSAISSAAISFTRASISSGAHDLVDEARGERLLRRSRRRARQDQLLHDGRAQQVHEARVASPWRGSCRACARWATPNCASGVAMRMSQQAAMSKPPPTAKPWIWAITGFFTRSSRSERAVAVALVGEALLGGLEHLELADVGAGHEGLAAGAAQDQDAHAVVGVHQVARLEQALVHGPRHRVAR